MGFTEKEVGHMTLRKFQKLYEVYKANFNLELLMRIKGAGYEDLSKEATINNVIPH